MRNLLVITAVVAVLVLAVIGLGMSNGTPVEGAKARVGDIREFVDERGKTRLPQIYSITMPYAARVEAIQLTEGTPVYAGQVIAQIVPKDVDLSIRMAQAAVDRLKASIRENDDSSVELTGLQQALSYVQSMNRTVEASRERVRSGEAKKEYADKNVARMERLSKSGAESEDRMDLARVAQVEAGVEYQQDKLIESAMESMQAATALLPTAIRQYIDRKSLTREVLEKQLTEAEVRLEQVKNDAHRGELRSPIDGVVLERLVSSEQYLAAGTELLKIGQLNQLEVEVDILSQDVVNVKPGDPAEVYGPAIGLKAAHAKVHNIYPAGFTKISSLGVEQQRVKVVLDFEPADLQRLRSERDLGVDYRVRVRIFTDEANDAILVPRSALFRGAEGTWQLFVVRGDRAVLQSVDVGLMNDDTVQIKTGLAADEIVVLAPETNLTDGTKVRPILREAGMTYMPEGD